MNRSLARETRPGPTGASGLSPAAQTLRPGMNRTRGRAFCSARPPTPPLSTSQALSSGALSLKRTFFSSIFLFLFKKKILNDFQREWEEGRRGVMVGKRERRDKPPCETHPDRRWGWNLQPRYPPVTGNRTHDPSVQGLTRPPVSNTARALEQLLSRRETHLPTPCDGTCSTRGQGCSREAVTFPTCPSQHVPPQGPNPSASRTPGAGEPRGAGPSPEATLRPSAARVEAPEGGGGLTERWSERRSAQHAGRRRVWGLEESSFQR